jgi:ketosteroid isomerase-like protein
MPARADLFADIDSMDPDRFAAHLSDDVRFRFGTGDTVNGREAVRDTWAAFCETVDGVHHTPRGRWESGEGTVVEADVTYTRKDASRVTVPVVTIYRSSGGELIDDYRVFIDLAPLFADPAPG